MLVMLPPLGTDSGRSIASSPTSSSSSTAGAGILGDEVLPVRMIQTHSSASTEAQRQARCPRAQSGGAGKAANYLRQYRGRDFTSRSSDHVALFPKRTYEPTLISTNWITDEAEQGLMQTMVTVSHNDCWRRRPLQLARLHTPITIFAQTYQSAGWLCRDVGSGQTRAWQSVD